jgi:small conductance mechanosensitive channel
MHRSTHRSAHGSRAAFTMTLALACSIGIAASGQEPEAKESADEIRELVDDLNARRVELEELQKKVRQNPDKAAAAIMEGEITERRSDYRRDLEKLVDQVLEAEDAGVDSEPGRQTASKLLEADAPKIRQKLTEQGKELITLVDTLSEGTPEEVEKARDEFVQQVETSSRRIQDLNTNIELRQRLGLDVERDVEYLKETLQRRADVTSGLLNEAKKKIDELEARPGIQEDPEAQKELASLRKERDAIAESQQVTVDIMDEYGLETAELRQGIISATGKLSDDILDKEVATGLVESVVGDGAEWLRTNGAQLLFKVVTFFLVLLAFWFVARIARGAVRRGLERSKLDVSSLAKDFFIKTTSRLIMLLGIVVAIAQLGIEIGPLLAGLGIAGFVVGFALQDTLSNFASGLMILVYRPFDVGDAVEAGGVTGSVHQMNLVSTMILTFDNQLLIVPNKQIWGGIIRNITHQDKRRVDMTFGIGYSDDIPQAEKLLTEIVTGHEKVLKDPEPVIRLHELGESSVNFVVRPWTKTGDYWDVTREVKQRFDEEGISIPFPQRDVHIYQDSGDNGGSQDDDEPQRSETTTSSHTPISSENQDED